MKLLPDLQTIFDGQTRVDGARLIARRQLHVLLNAPGRYVAVCSDPAGEVLVELSNFERTFSFDCECEEFFELGSCPHCWGAIAQASVSGWEFGDKLRDSEDEDSQSRDAWRTALACVRLEESSTVEGRWSSTRLGRSEIVYALTFVPNSGEPRVSTFVRKETLQEKPATCSKLPVRQFEQASKGDRVNRAILDQLRPLYVQPRDPYYRWAHDARSIENTSEFDLPPNDVARLLPQIAKTGRLFMNEPDTGQPLGWDPGGVWTLRLRLVDNDGEETFSLIGELGRDEERVATDRIEFVCDSLVCFDGTIAPFESANVATLFPSLLNGNFNSIPNDRRTEFLRELISIEGIPEVQLPPGWDRTVGTPRGRAVIRLESTPTGGRKRRRLLCEPYFDYGDGVVIEATSDETIASWTSESSVVFRDADAELKLVKELFEAGIRRVRNDDTLDGLVVTQSQLPALVRTLGTRGWAIEAEGIVYRSSGQFRMSVSSGKDWLDLAGGVEFDGELVPFARLLGQLNRGSQLVKLGDGKMGVLPEDWLRRAGMLLTLGEADGDDVRFQSNQAWVLDALLATQEHVDVDAKFEAHRRRLASFDGIEPKRERRSFKGTLRAYQRDGLGWLDFLREFGFGGCLADDMGLGKTVQLLAFLEELRVSKRNLGPHLIVAPRSVVGNWSREAARFAPGLSVIEYGGSGPDDIGRRRLGRGQVVLTTYGILRRRIVELREIEFDVVVLDEAQAIKNSTSQTAKASRLLRAHQHLALSGTPIENHMGELWSLFEFLNPGMLGRGSTFKRLLSDSRSPETERPDLDPVARAIRPFVLRRTKTQVLTDLPPKIEKTLYCEMGPKQRQLYDELRQHYRASLLGGKNKKIGKSKLQVLEALLRLRQAACHPGLLDDDRRGDDSVKLDVLIENIRDVVREGHKALVFSQFTKFLKLVQSALDREGIPHAYLDGKTRERDKVVDRFQNSADCPIFLISLKAGGLGLNLTAADYAFILDPWWNPAAEAQAIDRAHRIGQTRRVFAYRLIAKGTVEEKITELQQEKRELADSIIRADEGLLKSMTRDDLSVLLG